MYTPKLKYIFCLMRKRSLMPAKFVMRYMNSVGLVPQLLINGKYHSAITKELDLYKIKYNRITKLPDYDVMFSEAYGHCPFEKHCLTESKQQGKTNVVLFGAMSGWRNLVVWYYLPKNTKLIHGICTKIEETVLHYKEFTKDLFFVNVGGPDWDWWQTDEFNKKVEKVKLELGNKLLVLCEDFSFGKTSSLYVELCIKRAESLGFKVIINVHPDRWAHVPKQIYGYCNTTVPHHVLFKAASHAISNINSSTVAENLFLGTKVGCDPMVAHCGGWGRHKWLDKNAWNTTAPKHVKQEILNLVSTIFDEKDLDNFLSSSEPNASVESAEKAYGKINVPCYAEHLFETLDRKLIRKK